MSDDNVYDLRRVSSDIGIYDPHTTCASVQYDKCVSQIHSMNHEETKIRRVKI